MKDKYNCLFHFKQNSMFIIHNYKLLLNKSKISFIFTNRFILVRVAVDLDPANPGTLIWKNRSSITFKFTGAPKWHKCLGFACVQVLMNPDDLCDSCLPIFIIDTPYLHAIWKPLTGSLCTSESFTLIAVVTSRKRLL